MFKVKSVLINHYWAIILALLLSAVVASPQIYFRLDHRSDGIYQGIELLPDSPWSARVREVQDGHPNFGAIYFKDGKNNPYLFQPLGSMVVGYMGEVFNFDINNTLLLSRLVLSFLVFLLVYAFVFLLARDKLIALCTSAVLLFADSVLSYSGLIRLFQGISPDNFLRLARPVNPAMIYILFFSFLISFWLFYKGRDWRWGVVSSFLLGLNFYNYFYSWTFLYAFGGFLGLIFLIQRRWKEAFMIGGVFIGALFLAIPFGLNLYLATLHPAYMETSLRFGVFYSRLPLFIGYTSFLALIIFLLGYLKEDKEKYFFSLALLLSPLVTMNQQILTGKIMQVSHYHWFFHKPLAVIFVMIIFFSLLSRLGWGSYKKILAIIILISSIFVGIFSQAVSYVSDPRDGGNIAIERQNYGPVVKWLDQNVQKESVILANSEVSHLVAIYTSLNLFYHHAAIYSLSATKERLLDTLFAFYRLEGVDSISANKIFFTERGYISSNIYGMHYRETLGSYDSIPDEKIKEIITEYKKTFSVPKTKWLKDILEKYEVEYLVWDRKTDTSWRLEQYKFLQKVAEFGDLVIYQFIP